MGVGISATRLWFIYETPTNVVSWKKANLRQAVIQRPVPNQLTGLTQWSIPASARAVNAPREKPNSAILSPSTDKSVWDAYMLGAKALPRTSVCLHKVFVPVNDLKQNYKFATYRSVPVNVTNVLVEVPTREFQPRQLIRDRTRSYHAMPSSRRDATLRPAVVVKPGAE